jgi:hypothetical protein
MRARSNATPRRRTVQEKVVVVEEGLVEEEVVVVNAKDKNNGSSISLLWSLIEVSGRLIPLPIVKPALA